MKKGPSIFPPLLLLCFLLLSSCGSGNNESQNAAGANVADNESAKSENTASNTSDSIQSTDSNTDTTLVSDTTWAAAEQQVAQGVISTTFPAIEPSDRQAPANALNFVSITLATPGALDGKNGDNSILRISAAILTTDGKKHWQNVVVGAENTGIGPGNAIYVKIPFSEEIKREITRENIDSVQLVIGYEKPDYKASFAEDKWNARTEMVLIFNDSMNPSKVLATGYNNPQQELFFTKKIAYWYPFRSFPHSTFPRELMFTEPQLIAPFR